METMINLNDLLKHEILDLYSVEEQIIDAMPDMIDKAKNPELKNALRQHLKITEEQKKRLDKVKETFGESDGQGDGENKGFFSRLFGGGNGGEKCKGMEGIIKEGQKILEADITDEALDSAIIASAQKIEHYEICGYGTARAFARELKLMEVERMLAQTLNEEYEADDKLTALAVGKLNMEAEQADGMEGGNGRNRKSAGSANNGSSKSAGGRSGGSSKASSSEGGSKSASKSGASKGGGSKTSGKGGSSKGNSKSGGGKSKGGGNNSSGRSGASKGGSKASKSGGGSRGSKGGSKKAGSKGRR